ncbi:RNA polymerase sigma factor [Micromonospora sp. NPDC047730]|uniref:RNA polymerase sigma factor n=1 Tax=Micromonospora sp. NPDC047730 TaxID=3364253 RepID=UPI0037133D2F
MTKTINEQLAAMRPWCARKAEAMLPQAEVPDAVQEALIAIWKASPRVRPGRDPWPLLTVVARQEIARHARRFYDANVLDRIDEKKDADLPTAELMPASGDGELSFSPRIAAALATLPERQREILLETVAEGRTNLAAASLLGVSEARVRASVARSLELLRAALAEEVPA